MMKTLAANCITGLVLLVSMSLVSPIMAGHGDSQGSAGNGYSHQHARKNKFYDYARVIKVKPVYKQVKVAMPREECWDEHRNRPKRRHSVHKRVERAIVGGLIGGAIGHRLGKGSSKHAAALAGSLIGAAIGHQKSHLRVDDRSTEIKHRRRCESRVDYRYVDQADGYRVTYRYHGDTFHTRMQRHPGKRVRIKVQISLVD